MELETLSSGSNGNCYILNHKGKSIILDCGMRFEDITHSKAFKGFKNTQLVITTHHHSDHNRALEKFERSGCEIISYKTLKPKVEYHTCDSWTITTFPVQHNADNWGFIFKHKDIAEKFCYVTDFYGLPKIEGIDHWLIEVNYIEGIVDKMIEEERLNEMHTGFNFHNSLEKTKEYFSNIQTKPKTILCCHLSGMYGLDDIILKELQPFADKVEIARGGHKWKREAD